jgi:hypothetical protein
MAGAEPDPITILAGALARTDLAEREAYLDRTCGRDTPLL